MSNINVPVIKKVYGKKSYIQVINPEFTELISKPLPNNVESIESQIQNFFNMYNELFYDIPKSGLNSHETLIVQSTEYSQYKQESETIKALLEEINQLKIELLQANETTSQLNGRYNTN